MCCHKNNLVNLFTLKSAKNKLFIFAIVGIILFYSPTVNAQEEFIPSPSRLLTTIPFSTFTGGVVIVKAQLGDYPDSLNFILDTGSGGISLDSMTCVRLKIKDRKSVV